MQAEVPKIDFKKIEGSSAAYWAFVICMAIIAAAGVAAWVQCYMYGDWLTGLNNRVPWGLLVAGVAFAVGISAGIMVVLTMLSDVINIRQFKLFSRIAPFTAVLWVGAALSYVMMDIGRIDNLMAVQIGFNPTSVFAWNSVLYSTYIVLCLFYLLLKFEGKELASRVVGFITIVWTVILVIADGMIFGLIFSRALYHSPLTGPLFMASAITSGIGFFIPLMYLTFRFTKRYLAPDLIRYVAKIMGAGAAIVGCLMVCEVITVFYEPENVAKAYFAYATLPYSFLYWFLMFFIGIIIPIVIIWCPIEKIRNSLGWLSVAGILHVVGMWAEKYSMVVAGLQVPRELVDGYKMIYPPYLINIAPYTPTATEWLEFVGIIAAVLMIYALGIKFLALLPESTEGLE